jgi:hypothetical protein
MNIKYCRNGTTRVVLLVGKYALKVPNFYCWRMFLEGLMGNMQERDFATMNMPEVAPLLFSLPGGWLNVMPRVEVKALDAPDRFLYLDRFKEQLATSNHAELLANIVEMKVDSVGLWNGKVVAVDYGSSGLAKVVIGEERHKAPAEAEA